MRKQASKIEFVSSQGKQGNDLKRDLANGSSSLSDINYSGLPATASSVGKAPKLENMPSLSPADVINIVDSAIGIANGIIQLGEKIQETKQAREKTKQVKYQAKAFIVGEIEATKRMKIELEREKLAMESELKKQSLEFETRIRESEMESEIRIMEIDKHYELLKTKIETTRNIIELLLKEYESLSPLLGEEIYFKDRIRLREDIIRFSQQINDL